MSDPSAAEIEAGAMALYHDDGTPAWPWHDLDRLRKSHVAGFHRRKAEAVLRAVLPDHDAALRERIAQAIEAVTLPRPLPSHDFWSGQRHGQNAAAAIARQHGGPDD